ncbi:SpoIIE family protein phosphatase [Terrabacter sp. NPDC080008]|uniref:SpoIIE family protein phosphatase n=1 Tax=Terrabacter sp. NPDC080008 TaxID=3155176 RepID=UPI00344D2491
MVSIHENGPRLGAELIGELLAELPAAVAYLSGPEHRFELTNDAFRRLVGGRLVEGATIREALPELERQGYVELLDRVLRTGEAQHADESRLLVTDPGGRALERFVDLVCQPVRDQGGVPGGVLVQAADVSEHVHDRQRLEQLAQQVAEEQERYQSLFRTMVQGVVYHGADGRIIAANPAAGEMLGVDPERLVGLGPEDEQWNAVREDGFPFAGDEHPAAVALRTGTTVRGQVMGVRHGRTGERRWLSVTAVPDSFGPDGRPRRVYAMFEDVTLQRHTAAALQERDRLIGRLRDADVLGIVLADESRILDANGAFLRMLGYTTDDLAAGRIRWPEMTPPEWAPLDAAALEQLRSTGSCRPFEKEYLHVDGHRVPILLGAAVIGHEPLQWITFILDQSERHAAEAERARLRSAAEGARAQAQQVEERLGLLLRAGAVVAATHDPRQMLQQSVGLIVPVIGDFVAVLLPDRSGRLTVAAADHVAPERRSLVEAVDRPNSSRPGRGWTLETAFTATGAQLLRPGRAARSGWAASGTGLATAMEQLSANSLVTVPLVTHTRRAGLLIVGRSGDRTPFGASDVQVVEELGRRLGAGLANLEEFARDHSVAQTLQRAVLPEALPALAGLDLALRYLPATEGTQVGGDWYDAFLVDDDRLALVIGDVVGHDLGSASAMGQVRNALRAYAVDDSDPGSVLERTDRAVRRLLPDTLATVFYGRLELATGRLAYASAGHPPPVLVDGGAPELLDAAGGLLLGAVASARYATAERALARPCGLLLYSDGLIESRGRSLDEGLTALTDALAEAATGTADELCAVAERGLLDAPERADDVCMLAVRLT